MSLVVEVDKKKRCHPRKICCSRASWETITCLDSLDFRGHSAKKFSQISRTTREFLSLEIHCFCTRFRRNWCRENQGDIHVLIMKTLIRFFLSNIFYKNNYKKLASEELYKFEVACRWILKLRIAILKIFSSKFSILIGACLVRNYPHNATFADIIRSECYFCCAQSLQVNRLCIRDIILCSREAWLSWNTSFVESRANFGI